jgi:hypothetical protein
VLLLHAWGDLSYEEIAEALGVPWARSVPGWPAPGGWYVSSLL